ncbi:hypothetical protein [Woodsholea maritima]|uniref:hypothetical protein n=1 Tax=Woodsholea maritima TaxID=240237 RepID=UPI0012EAD2E3|nr:hypothetical protein [Woodsholea maritima]
MTSAFTSESDYTARAVRVAANRFISTAQFNQWVVEVRQDQTRQIFSRLLGGSDVGRGDETPTQSAGETYLVHLESTVSAQESVRSRFSRDLDNALDLSQRLAQAVEQAAEQPGTNDPHVLGDDVDVTERAISHLRRVQVTFREAFALLETDDREDLTAKLAALNSVESELSTALDRLAGKRWSLIHGAIG